MEMSHQIKFEQSPADSIADSFVSTPSDYPLFVTEDMTPPMDDEDMFGSLDDPPSSEKKPVKKRKSWGQQLPEPKTNLPPRKRAKTEDEKEQRRVERVLRNRRAAQSSRERKRLEVEALELEKQAIERRAQDLEMRLAASEAQRHVLEQQLSKIQGGMTTFNSPASQPDTYRQAPSPITLSQSLFGSHDEPVQLPTDSHINLQTAIQTVNPASLSPEMKPVAESTSNASSSDLTQHPAAVLCDLQCQSIEQRPWTTTPSSNNLISASLSILTTSLTFLLPLTQITHSLTTASSLLPTPSILTLIIWLLGTPAWPVSQNNSTSMNSSTTTARSSARPTFNLRMNLLRRLLACSPLLARPLRDATMGKLRSVSERLATSQGCAKDCAGDSTRSRGHESVEFLMTLCWAITVLEKEREHEENSSGKSNEESLEDLFQMREVRQPKMGSERYMIGKDGNMEKSLLWRSSAFER